MRILATALALLAQTTPTTDPALLSYTFNSLTNLAVLSAWHMDMKCALHKAYSLLDEGHWNIDGVSLLSLRFLINMSCNEDMIPCLLAAQVAMMQSSISFQSKHIYIFLFTLLFHRLRLDWFTCLTCRCQKKCCYVFWLYFPTFSQQQSAWKSIRSSCQQRTRQLLPIPCKHFSWSIQLKHSTRWLIVVFYLFKGMRLFVAYPWLNATRRKRWFWAANTPMKT